MPYGYSGQYYPSTRSASPSRVGYGVAVALLTLWAALLRADALVGRYGPLEGPRWASAVNRAAAVGSHLRPPSVRWKRVATPYVGGDPINYIKYAREMRSFYQPHVREPVFLALTRGFLWLVDGRDIAVSFASAFASVLVVPATYALGAAIGGPVVGLCAAAAWAIELDAIAWAVDGWRDDIFALFFTLTAWALVELRRDPIPSKAVLAGVVAGLACLTRLSSLSFVLVGLAWIALLPAPGMARARAVRASGLALVMTLLVAGPYMFSCWRATGDPFYAVNYHTKYYRYAQGLSPSVPEGALHFTLRQFAERPAAAFDTACGGLFTWPFESKWRGLRAWSPLLATGVQWSAVAGLVLLLWSAEGWLLLVLTLSSLLPYCQTWTLGGGGAWRFTEHVYPIYLVAAFLALRAAILGVQSLRRAPAAWRLLLTKQRLAEAALVACLAALVAIGYVMLPVLVSREALEASDGATIEAGARDWIFFRSGWSEPSRSGAVTVRVANAPQATIKVPLPRQMSCWLTLKMDPAETADPARQPRVAVFLNRRRLVELTLTRDPQRMGTYRLQVPENLTRDGLNDLVLQASHMVAASEAGRHFVDLDPQTPVAFRLWYVRVTPLLPAEPSADTRPPLPQ
jgi:Dolichyl-phosphate-mannose-protein mannosyltransferase